MVEVYLDSKVYVSVGGKFCLFYRGKLVENFFLILN